ncbi:Rv3235 family protein [Streptomyces sp. N35]|uniref:Rv3235 family protein n=1 Tax=Streptomyces sp. N35 TaxID=2795730 RepID=UPI0018F72738|nr:Rv3235 family protein [Streptomyces sp. N35]
MTVRSTRPTSRRSPAPRGPASRRDPRRPGEPRRVPVQQRPTVIRYWFAERLLAVLSGHRPVHWMLSHTVGDAYEQLARLAPRTPLRTRGTRPVIRDCGEHRPEDGVIEAFARIAAGDQLRAMAFRLEQGPDRRWKCAAVEVGAPA